MQDRETGMQKIFLIGYMGSGKTSVGKCLAQKIGLQFIDLDFFIENRYRKTINEIFEEKGEPGFRELEHRSLLEIVNFENTVISTGGGAPCFYNNMDIMNQSGITVYLKTSVDELAKRLDSCKHNRPLIKDKNIEELKEYITENVAKREAFYNQASIVIDVEKLITEKDINSIVTHLISNLPIEAMQ